MTKASLLTVNAKKERELNVALFSPKREKMSRVFGRFQALIRGINSTFAMTYTPSITTIDFHQICKIITFTIRKSL